MAEHDLPLQNKQAPEPPSSTRDRRVHPRFPVDCDATVSPLTSATRMAARLRELGLGGCLLTTERPFRPGVLVRVEVQFQLCGFAFRLVGVTVGSRGVTSFALRFVDMPARRRNELSEAIAEVASSRSAKLTPAKAPANPGLAVPVSISSAKPAKSSKNNRAEPPDSKLNTDRRSHSRHDVDTTSNLWLIKSGIAMRGRILNLSHGGCRLRTDEPFSVGIFVRVETEFYLHGLPFRLAGVSQAILDKNTIGIRFLDMSDRKRQQLTELIAELPQVEPYQPETTERTTPSARNRAITPDRA